MKLYNMDKTEFTQMLKRHGYTTVKAFANDVGMTGQQVFTYIRNRYVPDFKALVRFAEVLNEPVCEIAWTFPKYKEMMKAHGINAEGVHDDNR